MAIKMSGNGKATKDEFKYLVLEKCGVIDTGSNGWTTELRYIKWNDNEPKYDIRAWKETEDGEKMGKGITITGEQLTSLYEIIQGMMD